MSNQYVRETTPIVWTICTPDLQGKKVNIIVGRKLHCQWVTLLNDEGAHLWVYDQKAESRSLCFTLCLPMVGVHCSCKIV